MTFSGVDATMFKIEFSFLGNCEKSMADGLRHTGGGDHVDEFPVNLPKLKKSIANNTQSELRIFPHHGRPIFKPSMMTVFVENTLGPKTEFSLCEIRENSKVEFIVLKWGTRCMDKLTVNASKNPNSGARASKVT